MSKEKVVAQSDKSAEIITTLAKHADWDYTDRDSDMIKCVCGWESKVFLPRTRARANDIMAEHQFKKIARFLK